MQIPDFKDPNGLKQAFVHRSYLNEHREIAESNERLEFLGDAILSFVVSDWLYKKLTQKPEGTLTNLRSHLVNTTSLADIAKKLNLGDKLLLSRGEEEGGGRSNNSLLADTYEAVVGAIFLDQGLEAAREFIQDSLLESADNLTEDIKDPKSKLQELVQAKGLSSPIYRVLTEGGPDHDKVFTVAVEINGKETGQGSGKSKRAAETAAAQSALAKAV